MDGDFGKIFVSNSIKCSTCMFKLKHPINSASFYWTRNIPLARLPSAKDFRHSRWIFLVGAPCWCCRGVLFPFSLPFFTNSSLQNWDILRMPGSESSVFWLSGPTTTFHRRMIGRVSRSLKVSPSLTLRHVGRRRTPKCPFLMLYTVNFYVDRWMIPCEFLKK